MQQYRNTKVQTLNLCMFMEYTQEYKSTNFRHQQVYGVLTEIQRTNFRHGLVMEYSQKYKRTNFRHGQVYGILV